MFAMELAEIFKPRVASGGSLTLLLVRWTRLCI